MEETNYMSFTHPQFGGGLAYYRPSTLRQRGSGLGAVFGSVLRSLIPFARNFILPAAKKYVLPHAEEAIGNIAGDLFNGRGDIRQSIKSNGMAALKKIGKSVLDQSGSGRPRKRKHSPERIYSNKKPKITKPKKKNPKKKITKRITIF
jgi:hypothetical protein